MFLTWIHILPEQAVFETSKPRDKIRSRNNYYFSFIYKPTDGQLSFTCFNANKRSENYQPRISQTNTNGDKNLFCQSLAKLRSIQGKSWILLMLHEGLHAGSLRCYQFWRTHNLERKPFVIKGNDKNNRLSSKDVPLAI